MGALTFCGTHTVTFALHCAKEANSVGRRNIISHGMLDGFDAFQASLFNPVHGFYIHCQTEPRHCADPL